MNLQIKPVQFSMHVPLFGNVEAGRFGNVEQNAGLRNGLNVAQVSDKHKNVLREPNRTCFHFRRPLYDALTCPKLHYSLCWFVALVYQGEFLSNLTVH